MKIPDPRDPLENPKSEIRNPKSDVSQYVAFSLALLCAFLAVRLEELVIISTSNNLPSDFTRVVGQIIVFDTIFFLKMLPLLFLPFLLIRFVTGRRASPVWTYGITGCLVVVAYVILVQYFALALVPLGADLFGYSMKDVALIFRSSADINVGAIVAIVIPIAVFWVTLFHLSPRLRVRRSHAYGIMAAGIILVFGVSALPASTSFASEFSYNLAMNKAAYFTENCGAYFLHECGTTSVAALSGMTGVDTGLPVQGPMHFKYLSRQYPFLRAEETSDVLGDYFNTISSPASGPAIVPNIVFIQVEGLGRAFSGPRAYLGSFTPFLDELAAKSLYWENFLASQGRTFASLPSILGSLPFARRGFSDLGPKMPDHLSLFSILKHDGYRTGFYCGEDLSFDNQDAFMERQGADALVGIKDYDGGIVKGSSWGFADRDLMVKALQMEKQYPQEPYMSFLQTISTHTPYTIPGQQEYLRLFEERMNALGFDDAQKQKHRTYKNIYSCILYTDAALRYYMEEYAKLPSYSRTIFIITGDHRLPEIPMSTKIDRYHVPLIIFSPLLKAPARFASISSHLDITPSLLALLRVNYHVKTPQSVTWVGSGLDTEATLRNIHSYPLKQTTGDLHNFISGLFFLDQDVLFAINGNMDIEPIHNDEKMSELRAEFVRYQAMNDRFSADLKLMPDSEWFHSANLQNDTIKKGENRP